MPEMAKLIEVEREGDRCILHVDGEEFPWYIAPGTDIHVERGESPGVRLTILADEVRVEDRLRPPPPPEVDWLLRDAESGEEITRCSTRQHFLVGDVVTAPDGALWRIKRKDAESLIFDVDSYCCPGEESQPG